jgi:replication factor C subunit 3/5
MSGYVWVEKYRPTDFENIVLDPLNKKIFKNIINNLHFPNLLFFGPPGTGKTTTIINLINCYQEKVNVKNKDLIIHLNASDERGIDIIRNQINFFVNSNPLFNNGMKFVILDEVDYMTKNAQQALRYLLQKYSKNIRFCLICNYISKIDEGLQNEFIRLRFNQLPKMEIINFLKKISEGEQLNLSETSLINIQKLYKSDIRSMINFMQSNQDVYRHSNSSLNFIVINDDIWESLINKIRKKEPFEKITAYVYEISSKYNIDKKNIINDVLNYIIRNKILLNKPFLDFVENIVHSQDINYKININYLIAKLSSLL